jgi:hypothetical protein
MRWAAQPPIEHAVERALLPQRRALGEAVLPCARGRAEVIGVRE